MSLASFFASDGTLGALAAENDDAREKVGH
jgi:hypothetical protein